MKKNKINQEENIILDEETKTEDKKKPTAKKIVFAILLILLAVVFVVLGFCVVGGVFDVQTQCNVAYAYDATLPNDGEVGENILKNSSNISVAPWKYSVANFIGSNTFQSTANWGCVVYPLEDSVNSKTVTISARVRLVSGDGNITFNLRRFPSDGSASVGLQSAATISQDFVILSKTYDLSNFDSIKYNLCIYTSNKDSICEVDWVKLEYGDSFTGYIRSEEDLRTEYDALSNWRFYYTRDKVVGIVSPTGTGMYEVDGIKHYISKDTNFKVFLVPRTIKISDILNDDLTLKLKVKGLNTNDDVVRGVCYNLFDLTGYREYYYICAMASQTPKTRPSEGSTNGCLMYSYDTKTKTLYEINPKTFPDVSTEERYLDIVNFYEDFGRNSEQSDFNSSTNGIISVIQSPVNFLKDIFNFEIFGINVSAVVFFVLSITIVAFVIKKVV